MRGRDAPFMTALRELSGTTPLPQATVARPGAPTLPAKGSAPSDDVPSPFHLLMRSMTHEADRGEATVASVLGGSAGTGRVALDPTHLLALQAGIYRYGETRDLAARLVEKAATGVKTVVQGQ